MRKMAIVTSSAIAVLMGGAALAPAAGAAEIASAGTTVAAHHPVSHQIKTRRVCHREVTFRHHRRHVQVVCHTVRVNNHDMGNGHH